MRSENISKNAAAGFGQKGGAAEIGARGGPRALRGSDSGSEPTALSPPRVFPCHPPDRVRWASASPSADAGGRPAVVGPRTWWAEVLSPCLGTPRPDASVPRHAVPSPWGPERRGHRLAVWFVSEDGLFPSCISGIRLLALGSQGQCPPAPRRPGAGETAESALHGSWAPGGPLRPGRKGRD